MTIPPPSEAVVHAARHLDPTEGRSREGTILTSSDVAAINTVLRYIAAARNTQAETSQEPSRETRQDATGYALAWAARADRYAAQHRDADRPSERDPNPSRIQRLAELGLEARETALMWASIARLLPAVLDDQPKPEPCDHERPNLGTDLGGTRCILPTGHHLPHRDHTGTSWNPGPQQCRSRHDTHDGEVRCDRQHGHHGPHSRPGYNWPNPSQGRANAATSTSLPGPRKTADDTSSSAPTPAASTRSGCCEQAIRDAASTLRQHARTAPGITAYERRCLEDAVDFITHHATKALPEPEREAPCDRWIAREAHPAHTFVSRIDGPVRCPGVEPGGKGGQP